MTARRSSGSASAASAAFGRAFAGKQSRPAAAADVDAGPAPVEDRVQLAATPDEAPRTKYTLLLDSEEALNLDQLVLSARRQLGGKKVEKSTLLRVLINLAADDSALLAQVVGEIRRRGRA